MSATMSLAQCPQDGGLGAIENLRHSITMTVFFCNKRGCPCWLFLSISFRTFRGVCRRLLGALSGAMRVSVGSCRVLREVCGRLSRERLGFLSVGVGVVFLPFRGSVGGLVRFFFRGFGISFRDWYGFCQKFVWVLSGDWCGFCRGIGMGSVRGLVWVQDTVLPPLFPPPLEDCGGGRRRRGVMTPSTPPTPTHPHPPQESSIMSWWIHIPKDTSVAIFLVFSFISILVFMIPRCLVQV